MSDWILTTISLMLSTIVLENTLNRIYSQLSVLMRCKKNIAHTTKTMKARVIMLNDRGRMNANQISDGGNTVDPKVRWDGIIKHKNTSSLKNMVMPRLSNPILSMSTRIRT
jgi:hypothetical protein